MDDQSQEFCGLTARLYFEYKCTVSPWTLDQFENPSGNDVWESFGRRKKKGEKIRVQSRQRKHTRKEQPNDKMM